MTAATEGLRRILDEVSARPPSADDPRIDGLAPALVLEPEDAEGCSRVVALCHRESLALVPVGGATRLHVGNIPTRLDAYLGTGGLHGVEDYIPGDLTVAVRAGTPLAELQAVLAEEGQFLPVDPPLSSRATVGGVFAFGEPGFRRRPGARPRDLLLGFEAVLADGTVFKSGGRVVKNVSGYELVKLLVGSAGTLAILTRLFLRVRALPETVSSVLARFRRAVDVAVDWKELASSPVAPEAAALVNPAYSGTERWGLLLRFEGFGEEVREGVEVVRRALHGVDVSETSEDAWEEVSNFPVTAPGASVVLRGQTVPARTYDLADRWRDGGALVAYPEAGLVYSRTEDPEALGERLEQAKLLGANVVLEKAPPEMKQDRDVFGELPSGFELMRGIKEKLDPRGVLSPGRFVGRI